MSKSGEETSAIIAPMAESEFVVYTNGNNLIVKAQTGKACQVYFLSGRIIYNKILSDDQEIIPLQQKGLYIVRVGNSVKKVVMY